MERIPTELIRHDRLTSSASSPGALTATPAPSVVKYDAVSLSPRAQPAKWDSIKALNPACQRLTTPGFYTYYYVGPSGYPSQSSGPFSTDDPVYGNDRKFWDMLNDNQWWAWCVDSVGTRYHATPFWQMSSVELPQGSFT